MIKRMVIAAHPDDEVLGCGGLIAQNSMDVRVVICMPEDDRVYKALKCLNVSKEQVTFLDIPDNEFPSHLRDLIQKLDLIVGSLKPDEIYYHFSDTNQDHQVVNKAVKVVCRRFYGKMLEFIVNPRELAKLEGNYFIDIEKVMTKKILAIQAYDDRITNSRRPLDPDTLFQMYSWNGRVCGRKYAEIFKLIQGVF